MKRLSDLLARREGGVYRWVGAPLEPGDREAGGPEIVTIDAPDTKSALLQRLASALQLPEWFGHNWDALEECLADLPQATGHGVIVELRQLNRLAAHDPDSVRTLLDVFEEAAGDWRGRGGMLLVLAEGAGRLAGDVDQAGP